MLPSLIVPTARGRKRRALMGDDREVDMGPRKLWSRKQTTLHLVLGSTSIAIYQLDPIDQGRC
jgi:hypothetical protein